MREFERVSEQRCGKVGLQTAEDRNSYEQKDRVLAEKLDFVLGSKLGLPNRDILYHQIYDWWPTQTRFVEIDSSSMSIELIQSVQCLLADEYRNWAVNFQIYQPLESPESLHLGAISVYRDDVVGTKSALASCQLLG